MRNIDALRYDILLLV